MKKKVRKSFKEGDLVFLKKDHYGYLKIKKLLPIGSHKSRCKLAEVYHSTSIDFVFCFIRVFKLSDLTKEQK